MYSTAPSTRRLTPNSAATTRCARDAVACGPAHGRCDVLAERVAASTRSWRGRGPPGIRAGYAKRPLLTRKVVYSHGS